MKVSFFVVVLLFGLLIFTALFFFSETEKEEAFVTKVIDGDTLELNNSEKVRLRTNFTVSPMYAWAFCSS